MNRSSCDVLEVSTSDPTLPGAIQRVVTWVPQLGPSPAMEEEGLRGRRGWRKEVEIVEVRVEKVEVVEARVEVEVGRRVKREEGWGWRWEEVVEVGVEKVEEDVEEGVEETVNEGASLPLLHACTEMLYVVKELRPPRVTTVGVAPVAIVTTLDVAPGTMQSDL